MYERRFRSVEDDNVSFFARLFGRDPHPIGCPLCASEGDIPCELGDECVDPACLAGVHPCPECGGLGEVMPIAHPSLDLEVASLATIPVGALRRELVKNAASRLAEDFFDP